MDGFIGILGVVALLLVVGGGLGLLLPGKTAWLWLLAAAGLVLVNDAMLTRVWGLIPDVIPRSDWNWQGKFMALAVTLAVASLPMFGWKRSGLTLTQASGSWKTALPVTAAYAGLFLIMALTFPNESASKEAIAFQLTMPGLEEEPFYRGVLLLALGRAFSGRLRFLGVDWSLGAILSCALFGLAHAFGFSDGAFSFDLMTMALTGLPSLIAVWLVLRTRSLLLPILMHNFGNAIMLLV